MAAAALNSHAHSWADPHPSSLPSTNPLLLPSPAARQPLYNQNSSTPHPSSSSSTSPSLSSSFSSSLSSPITQRYATVPAASSPALSFNTRSLPSTPFRQTFAAPRTQVSSLYERRKSQVAPDKHTTSLTRQRTIDAGNVSSNSSSGSGGGGGGAGGGGVRRVSRSGKPSLGPLLPIRVSMADSSSPVSSSAPVAVGDDEHTPANASDSFEEAQESASGSLGVDGRSNELKPTDGLGISGDETTATAQNENDPPGDDKPKMSGRLSRIVDPDMDAAMMFNNEDNEDEEDTPAQSTESTIEPAQSNHGRQHSRQKTLETAPELLPPPVSPRPVLSRPIPVRPVSFSRERSVSPVKIVPGLSGDVTISSPPPSTADRINALQERHIGERPSSATSPPTALAKKPSSGFAGFLGRMGSIRRTAKSPPPPRPDGMFGRRSTAASIDSAAGGTLASIADGHEDIEADLLSPSLQDQFQILRKKEENATVGINGFQGSDGDDNTSITGGKSSGASTTGPPSPSQRRTESMSSIKTAPINPDLPPGTASGMTAGPAELPRPVDWDMWQALVMEGPAAVTKSSGQELNTAIASGIPAAIRGVVWQILAESKNEELEALYQTLKNRGAGDSDHSSRRPLPASRSESQSNISDVGEESEKLSQRSSRNISSPDSQATTPPASTLASPPPSLHGEEAELRSKLLAEKQKRESASLQKLEKAIKRDMGSRTSYSKFTQSAGLQDGLFGVCKAYALFDEGVGYAQGINFIAMPLLFNMSEGEAFALLVRLMSKYDVRSLFVGDMAGLHLRLYQFERLLEDHDPALFCHLKRRHVSPQLYATQWFLTMFAYRFPLQLVLRVYDLVFSEGLTAILKFGIVLLRRNRDALLEMKDMGHLTNFLKEKVFDVYIDKSPSASSLLDSGFFGSVSGGADKELYRADEMVRDACEIHVSETVLAAYMLEWEEQQRTTHERETELEQLRTSTANLSAQVKSLEERTQTQDAEHVQLASELVRVKVENDALHDEVEGLKLRNEELQRLVDSQPAEVESRLRDEMERIMQRNSVVQNENRALKEEMDETERALVDAKMQHAQTQNDYDTLTQRWSNVQAMFADNK